jgi:hypothetical protein
MAASTAPRYDQGTQKVSTLRYPVAAATKIYNGTLVMVVLGTGYLVPAADTASGVFVGIAQTEVAGGTVDNSAGAAGANFADVQPVTQTTPQGTQFFLTNCSGAAQATWQDQFVYASDDHTVTLAAGSTNKVCVGRVKQVISATQVLVDGSDRSAVATS